MTTAETERDQDVIELLMSQHEQIKDLFRRIPTAAGADKRELFHDLTRLLAVHESAEEQVVHPAARKTAGDDVVNARLEEENQAKQVLSDLYQLGTDATDFDGRLADFAASVIDHAMHEERDEFVTLRSQNDPQKLRRMAGAVRAAEAIAPTRPHPAAGESPVANMVAGPPAALFDRARDAVRDWRTQNDHD
jgi:hemerythrin superfamily protein